MLPDKIELKKISLNFRTVASRFLRTDKSDGIVNLRKFLNFIHSQELIKTFIKESNRFSFDIGSQIKAIQNSYDEYPIPEDNDEEISYIYQFLVYVAENCTEYRHPISYAYGGTKFQDQVDEFNKRFVLPFVNYISTYLDELLLEIDDGAKGNHITVRADGGQVNISQEKSSLTATQTVTKVDNDLETLFELLSKHIEGLEISQNDRSEALEVLELAKSEVVSSAPKRSILKMAVQKLSDIKDLGVASVATAKTIQDVIEFISSFIK